MAIQIAEPFNLHGIPTPSQALNFEFLSESVSIDRRSINLKRARANSDVDGNLPSMDVSKKRRLRKQLITSRLSSPYSQPAAHVANAGRCKIALWARQRPLSSTGLRKAAMLNAAHMQIDPTASTEPACSHQSSPTYRGRRSSFEEDKAPPVPCTHPPLHMQNPNFRPVACMVATAPIMAANPSLQSYTTPHMSSYNYDALDDDIDDRSQAVMDEEEDTYVPHPDFARKTSAPPSNLFVSPLPSPSPSPPRRPVGMAVPVAQQQQQQTQHQRQHQQPPSQPQTAIWTTNATDALISPLAMPGQLDFEATMASWLNLDMRPPSPPDEGLLQWFRDRDAAFDAW